MPSRANLLALYVPVLGKPPSAAMLEICSHPIVKTRRSVSYLVE
jgi:hypothetical protein